MNFQLLAAKKFSWHKEIFILLGRPGPKILKICKSILTVDMLKKKTVKDEKSDFIYILILFKKKKTRIVSGAGQEKLLGQNLCNVTF